MFYKLPSLPPTRRVRRASGGVDRCVRTAARTRWRSTSRYGPVHGQLRGSKTAHPAPDRAEKLTALPPTLQRLHLGAAETLREMTAQRGGSRSAGVVINVRRLVGVDTNVRVTRNWPKSYVAHSHGSWRLLCRSPHRGSTSLWSG